MLSAQDNAFLVTSEPNTPMGNYLRCHWNPVALSEEVAAPDCPPIRVKVMGEDLLLFRDTNGNTGLIEPFCAHRGADLFFGRNEECGIRCIYHGWKYDIHGNCIDMPNVPKDAAYHGKIKIKAYPTKEFADMVWAYMGLPELQPVQVPQLEAGLVPPSHRYVTKRLIDCNWVHSMEGALDTAHFSFLHMPAPAFLKDDNTNIAADEKRIRWLRNDPVPRFKIIEHAVGFLIGGARHADPGDLYWRLTQYMLPTHSITPSAMPNETFYGYSWTPIDDHQCWMYVYAWHPELPIPEEERKKYIQGGFGQFAKLGPGYVPVRNRSNQYLMSREEQKTISFTGIQGIAEQDQMAQESQGYIVDRTKEHLSPTDVGIIRFRKILLDDAKAYANGKQPDSPHRPQEYCLRGGGAHTKDSLSLEEVMQERFNSIIGKV
jgi:phenylpropionate dioxygenase-like ring-hydroxylating dioxygenase large terminal subunit